MSDRLATRTPTGPVVSRHPALRAAVRLRLTTAYVLLLTVTASWLATQGHAERARFVRHNSSNVHHMELETCCNARCSASLRPCRSPAMTTAPSANS